MIILSVRLDDRLKRMAFLLAVQPDSGWPIEAATIIRWLAKGPG